jgi:hypothetical protein
MKENFRPHPENPKNIAPEAGAGPLGVSPPDSEQAPQGRGTKNPERQPIIGQRKGEDEPIDLNVRSANTGEADSPETGLKDKSPVIDPPRRRRRGGAICGIRLYDEDEGSREPENKSPVKPPRKRRGGGAL